MNYCTWYLLTKYDSSHGKSLSEDEEDSEDEYEDEDGSWRIAVCFYCKRLKSSWDYKATAARVPSPPIRRVDLGWLAVLNMLRPILKLLNAVQVFLKARPRPILH